MSEPIQVRIKGDSMWPTFSDGSIVKFTPLEENDVLKVGDVVLSHHPLKKNILLVKRVHLVETDDRYFLVGDQTDPLASEDSHNFGSVPRSSIIAYHLE